MMADSVVANDGSAKFIFSNGSFVRLYSSNCSGTGSVFVVRSHSYRPVRYDRITKRLDHSKTAGYHNNGQISKSPRSFAFPVSSVVMTASIWLGWTTDSYGLPVTAFV